ncbi:4655_t:CDS:2, partial [Ambispora leptoticha]
TSNLSHCPDVLMLRKRTKKSQEINIPNFADMKFFEETVEIEIDDKADEEIDQIEEIGNKVDIEEIDDNAEGKIQKTRVDEELEYVDLNMHFIDAIHDVLLIDDIEEDPINDEILEETSSEFEGFDGEYGTYFSNFMSAALYI